MQNVSDAWKQAHTKPLLPETFVEISVGISDVEARELVTASSDSEAFFSNTESVVGDIGIPYGVQYATLEHNLWLLDGSRRVLPDEEPYQTTGYVSSVENGNIVLKFLEIRFVSIPGFTITWSNEYGEYPTAFSVTVQREGIDIAYKEITNNTDVITTVDMDVSGYDAVIIRIIEWNTPNHRTRIDRVFFGHVISFGKQDILSYTHEQRGDLNSGELPKNSIDFSLNNVDEVWNPNNTRGLGRYLSERQTVIVRYGMRLCGNVEWINAGTFFMSEWRVPANGMAAHFKARDAFEFMLNEPYTGIRTGTLYEFINAAITLSDLPESFSYYISDVLSEYSATMPDDKDYTAAEVIQLCANAACCVIYQNRDGVLCIEKHDRELSDYFIGVYESYAHPEVELSKPLKLISVDFGEKQTYVLNVAASGEKQTVKNPLVSTETQAAEIANWVSETLKIRSAITGEMRPDLRLDVFDVITIESKYGLLAPVAITDVKYTYNGAFNASYSGITIADISLLSEFVLRESRMT